MFSIPAAPAKQSVNDTINVLSGRLGSATLLEDRRAAILGLRSFAKEYPATVASGALRCLIGSLSKDGEDVDTVKVVLETLLMLFNPNEESPEASDEIVLWLADEFTQRQENITLLLEFLDASDFYSRLYSLQLLIAILSARTERTEECVFTAPLGISRLVATLDDQRDAVRNEAITLLTYLTPTSTDVQKLVAFENAFDRIFGIIASEGSLTDGGRAVEDCLILLANLLRRNTSNQSLFRESGGVLRLSKLLESAFRTQDEEEEVDVAPWAQTQRNRNIYALLALVRLLLAESSVGTPQNQAALWQHGFLYHALQLAFSHVAQTPIKAEALVTCADVIRGNSGLQESFAQLQVPSPLPSRDLDGGKDKQNAEISAVYVIDGLLDLTLTISASDMFDVRQAACECLKAYFFKHADIRLHFLKRAIEGHKAGVDETANVLTVLMQPAGSDASSNPYRIWFAAIITFHLLFDNPEAKSLAMAVTEGDADSGEELVTGIQTVAAHLLSGLNREQDSRIVTGYLILLLGWMFEDLDAVDDFLGEGSNIQSLIQAIIRPAPTDEIVQGLCAMLLGEVYEFSTKDSPIPRASLHSILSSRMGREHYVDKLSKLRSHPFMRDFEVLPQKLDPATGGQPDVFFDATFVDFFKDNYSRIARAMDRDPGMEISVLTNGVQKGISRELVDSLRAQVEEKGKSLEDIKVATANLEGQLGHEQADHRRTRELAAADLAKANSNADVLRRELEAELDNLRRELTALQDKHRQELAQTKHIAQGEQEELHRKQASVEENYKRQLDYVKKTGEAEVEKMRRTITSQQEEHQKQLEQSKKAADADADRIKRRVEADAADLRATISRLEVDLMKANKSKTQELQSLREEHTAEIKKLREQHLFELEKQKAENASIKNSIIHIEAKLKEAQEANRKSDAGLKEAEEARQSTQSELDDLLMVFADLEDKVAKYKERLRQKGEQVSEGEDDEDDSDNEEDSKDDSD